MLLDDDPSIAKTKRWDRRQRADFAKLLVVELPANYIFPPNPQKIALWQVRRGPSQFARPVGRLNAGDRITVVETRGAWIRFTLPRSRRQGWALTESNGVRYIRPVMPKVVYPWQRGRGSGLMYEDILMRRRVQLRQKDLASNENLLKEWHALIAELDAVLRMTHYHVNRIMARGRHEDHIAIAEFPASESTAAAAAAAPDESSLPQRSCVRKPRSNSFMELGGPRDFCELPTEAIGDGDAPALRPRSNSFVHRSAGNGPDAADIRAWKVESAEWVPPQPCLERRLSGEEELQMQEKAIKERARREAKSRVDRTERNHRTYRRILTEQLLQEHNRQSDERVRRKPRSNSLCGALPSGLASLVDCPNAGQPAEGGTLFRFSWEKNQGVGSWRPLAPEMAASPPCSPSRGKHRSRQRCRPDSHSTLQLTSPTASDSSYASRRSLGSATTQASRRSSASHVESQQDTERLRRKGRARSRSFHLATRRADGARMQVFVPAVPK